MITDIEIKNYSSFVYAKATLSPFTLVIGPNGAGKSNFLHLLNKISTYDRVLGPNSLDYMSLLVKKHYNHTEDSQRIAVVTDDGERMVIDDGRSPNDCFKNCPTQLFSLDPGAIGRAEQISPDVKVANSGVGAVAVIDGLKTGDREDLFNIIECHLRKYVPSIEKLSTQTTSPGVKALQVREVGIQKPFPVSELSEGTKLILLILTIAFYEHTPKLLLLEDLDHGLHPRLFQQVTEMLKDLTREKGIQIIATTHNPYMVDQFEGDEDAVLIVEKINAESTITSLAERLEAGDTTEGALGSLWYGGFVGGVPEKLAVQG